MTTTFFIKSFQIQINNEVERFNQYKENKPVKFQYKSLKLECMNNMHVLNNEGTVKIKRLLS